MHTERQETYIHRGEPPIGIPAGFYAVPKHTLSARFTVKLEIDTVSV